MAIKRYKGKFDDVICDRLLPQSLLVPRPRSSILLIIKMLSIIFQYFASATGK